MPIPLICRWFKIQIQMRSKIGLGIISVWITLQGRVLFVVLFLLNLYTRHSFLRFNTCILIFFLILLLSSVMSRSAISIFAILSSQYLSSNTDESVLTYTCMYTHTVHLYTTYKTNAISSIYSEYHLQPDPPTAVLLILLPLNR